MQRVRDVYGSMNRPLTIGGADRRLFFVALVVGGATFTFFGSLFSGVLMFAALFGCARWVAARDPQLLHIVLRSARARRRYDPGKRRSDDTVFTHHRGLPTGWRDVRSHQPRRLRR